MNITKKILNDLPLDSYVVTDVSGSSETTVEQILKSGVETAKIDGTVIYAPPQAVSSMTITTYDLSQYADSIKTGSITVNGLSAELSSPVRKASASEYGQVKINGEMSGPNEYALKINDSGYAYVNVPWTDKFCTSAWYDSSKKTIYLSVGTDTLSVNVAELVNAYSADESTITKSNDNTFSVKDNVFVKKYSENELSNLSLANILIKIK